MLIEQAINMLIAARAAGAVRVAIGLKNDNETMSEAPMEWVSTAIIDGTVYVVPDYSRKSDLSNRAAESVDW